MTSADTLNNVVLTGSLGIGIAGFVRFSVYNWMPIEPDIPAPPVVIVPLVDGSFSASLVATDSTIDGVPLGWMWAMLVTVEGVDYEPVVFSLPYTAGAQQEWSSITPSGSVTQPVPFALAGTLVQYTAPSVVMLTDAATIAVNAALGNDFRLAMTSAIGSTRQLGTPANPVDGQRMDVMVTQPASGGPCLLTYSAAYLFSTNLPAPTLSVTAGYTDILGFIYNAALSAWLLVAFLASFA